MRDLDLGRYAREWALPRQTQQQDPLIPYFMVGSEGIDLQVERQMQRLCSWTAHDYVAIWRRIRSDKRINLSEEDPNESDADTIVNGYYPTPDAEIYAAMITDLRPSLIVEVGAGFSTLVARHAIDYLGGDCQLVAVDPNPRTSVLEAADDVALSRVEDIDLGAWQWQENSILFIDSNHICRPRGDLPARYCMGIPDLPTGVVVHVHDIYLPWDYPAVYDEWLWTEQYLLHCLLAHTARYEVLFATHYMTRTHPAEMRALFGPKVGRKGRFSGASFWFRVRSDQPIFK